MSDKWPEEIRLIIDANYFLETGRCWARTMPVGSEEEANLLCVEIERRWRAYPKLVEALATIPEHRFRLLAAWLDLDDKYKGGGRLTEVQDDLRRFADRIVALREAGEL